ncbi:AAA family ATPase [Luedemannella flava]
MSIAELRTGLSDAGYLADDTLATALFLAVRMGQPLLLEGEPGVGKTAAAKALAAALDTPLIRLQCYEGLTSAEALYEWNYPGSCWRSGWPRRAGRSSPRPTCSARTSCCPGRCSRRCSTPGPCRRCCSSTRSTGPTTSSRRTCSSCSPRAR